MIPYSPPNPPDRNTQASYPYSPGPSLWDTSLAWGSAPKVNGAFAAGATQIDLTGLGSGWLPLGAWFTIGGEPDLYVLQADALVVNGIAAGVLISPGLADDVADQSEVGDFNALISDADLTMQESRMPALGKKISAIGTGSTAYDGKRALAKRDIGQWLFRRGYALSGIRDLTQFNRAAVYLELSYIYRDLATRNDEISADKAAYYLTQFGTEIESISIIYSPPPDGGEQAGKRSVATWWRS